MRSRAVIFTGADQPMAVDEVEFGDPAPGDVLVKLSATGICHSDLHYLRGYRPVSGPTLMGHEGTGQVVAVGDGVTHVVPGDRIITSIVRRDGNIIGEGRANSRSSVKWHGRELEGHRDSVYTWAEHALLDADYVVKVPADTPVDVVAPIGCGVMTGVGTVTNALNVQAGRSCAVYGLGGVGLSAVAALRIRGADPIIAVDLSDEKLEFARNFGATETVNAAAGDPVERIRELTGGGTDYAIDAIGARGTTQQIVDTVRGQRGRERGGVAAMIATGNVVRVPTGSMVLGEKSLIGVKVGSTLPERDFLQILRWHKEGLFDLNALVTERRSIDEINEAAERLNEGKVLGRSIVVL
jgi:Zn-dependent alcohol dehydrogenase